MKSITIYLSVFLFCGLCSVSNENLFGSYFHPYIFIKPLTIRVNPLQCETNEECQNKITNSICKEKLCVCSNSTFLNSDGTNCINEVKEFGSPCEDNIQCSKLLLSGGACIDHLCRCKPGYHYLKSYCWKNSGLGESCSQNEQCYSDYEYVGLECREKVCRCRVNYYERLGRGCRRERKKGESCNLSDDCRGRNLLGEMKEIKYRCENLICKSEGEKFLKNDNYTNLTLKRAELTKNDSVRETYKVNDKLELGQRCSKNEDCSQIKGSICLDNRICACEPPLRVASENNRKCLKVSMGQVDDIRRSFCEENVQCNVFGENSHCLNKKCACKSGSYWENTQKYCWTLKSLGEKCSDERDCHPKEKHAECDTKNKICSCKKGYHEKNQICEPDAVKVGDVCEEDEDCMFSFSSCDEDSGKCVCKEHYNVVDGHCQPGIQSLCEKDADCDHLKNTKCITGNSTSKQCLCDDGYVKSDDNKYCLASALYAENCTESFQCRYNLGELGDCKKGVCQCNSTAHYSSGKCYKSAFLGESCSKRLECFPGNDTNSVICLKGFCACNYQYTPVDKRLCLFANSATIVKFYPQLLMVLPLLLTFRN